MGIRLVNNPSKVALGIAILVGVIWALYMIRGLVDDARRDLPVRDRVCIAQSEEW